jgi:hypothetical protein
MRAPAPTDESQYPIFINCRDRLSCLLELIDWLEAVNQRRIYLVDNGSTYPKLLEYYASSPYEVVQLGENLGQHAPWTSGLVGRYASGEFYAVTDPDVVPVAECPTGAIDHFRELLERYPDRTKVGFGLKIDDLPRRYRLSEAVVEWESKYWEREVEPGVFDAQIDTTFALYRPGATFEFASSLRTGPPYVARHTAWYMNSRWPTREERFYRRHARQNVMTWGGRRLPERHRQMAGVARVAVGGSSALGGFRGWLAGHLKRSRRQH